jgi:tetratricopeptide (TPR) repeat protein
LGESWRIGHKTGRFQGAIRAFQEAIRLDPYETSYYFQLAFLQQQEGQLADAAVTYHQVIARASEDEVGSAPGASPWNSAKSPGNRQTEKVLHPCPLPMRTGLFFRACCWKRTAAMCRFYTGIPHGGFGCAAQTAREELSRIASRALKPLLDVLASEKRG